MPGSGLDRRHTVHDSGWHGPDGTYGDGIQHHVIDSVPELADSLEKKNGIPGLELINPSDAGFAARASEILRRDGFVCIADVMAEELRASLQARCEQVRLA